MGLDMSLILKTKGESGYCSIPLIEWRKANQIRKWFVDHLENFDESDNCGRYLVTKEDLEFLVEDINEILMSENKVKTAKEIMPTSYGFFFGGTEYDDDYFETLEKTLQEVIELLDTLNWKADSEIYYTEWW